MFYITEPIQDDITRLNLKERVIHVHTSTVISLGCLAVTVPVIKTICDHSLQEFKSILLSVHVIINSSGFGLQEKTFFNLPLFESLCFV